MKSASDMNVVPMSSLAQFIHYIESLQEIVTKPLFRGQGRRRNLIPSIARKSPGEDTESRERRMLRQFRLQGASMLTPKLTELELLVIAQHFGMKTRLLDWTTNPLAALWFACSSRQDGDVYVYMLNADSFQEQDIYDKSPFEHGQTLVFQPQLDNPRVLAQNGWFTLHRYAGSSHAFVPLEQQGQMRGKLSELAIPEAQRPSMLKSLLLMGVDDRTMYPGLEGLGISLNKVFVA
jgi:hypothetical protein